MAGLVQSGCQELQTVSQTQTEAAGRFGWPSCARAWQSEAKKAKQHLEKKTKRGKTGERTRFQSARWEGQGLGLCVGLHSKQLQP